MATEDRELYAKKVATDLNELSTKLSILEAASRQKAGDQNFDYDTRLGQLQERHDKIEDELDTLQDGGAEDWETTRSQIEDDLATLHEDLETAMHDAGLTTEREKEKEDKEDSAQQKE